MDQKQKQVEDLEVPFRAESLDGFQTIFSPGQSAKQQKVRMVIHNWFVCDNEIQPPPPLNEIESKNTDYFRRKSY